jgi:hypothetical protein
MHQKMFVTFTEELYWTEPAASGFSRFCEGNVDLNDEPHIGHPTKVDENQICALNESYRHL